MRQKRSAFQRRLDKLATFGRYKAIQQRGIWLWKYQGTKGQYVAYTRATHCAICGTPFTGPPNAIRCQDHCHVTGRLRAVLCNHCNQAQGHLRTKENAMKMVEYFVKWEIMPVAPTTTETIEIPDAYEGLTLFDVSNSPLEPPLTPIAPVVTVGGTTTQRQRSVCVVPHAITHGGAPIGVGVNSDV